MPGGHQRLTESADEKGAATSPKNRQLPPAVRRANNVSFHARSRVPTQLTGLTPRPCGTQKGGSYRAATHPPLPHARRRLVLCGHGPACPVRSRTGLSCPVTDRLVLSGHGPACPVRSRTRTGGQPIALRARAAVRPAFLSAAPFKAVELRSTPGKLLKKFDQNFFAPPAALFRPCGTQKGGLSRPATDRLVLCGHAPLTCLRRILQTPGLQSPR